MDTEANRENNETAPVESSPSLLSSPGGDGTGVEPTPAESIPPSLSSLGGGGSSIFVDHDEQDEDKPCRETPTIVFIVAPMIIILVGTFLAAAFMPKTQTNDNAGKEGPPPLHSQARKHGLRDRHRDGLLWNVGNTYLYEKLERATFRQRQSDSDSAKMLLKSDKNEVYFGDALTLTWDVIPQNDDGIIVNEKEDVLALYCPAGEADPRRFLDAVTISHARANTSSHYSTHHDDGMNEPNRTKRGYIWSIPSFPVLRGEETCQFRFYAHSIVGGAAQGMIEQHHHRYTLISVTDPISLISKTTPTGMHIEAKERN